MTNEGQQLIFLISQPRSGSTLLQRMLQSHSEIHSAPEPWIMLHPLYGLKEKGMVSEYNSSWESIAVKEFYKALSQGEESYYSGVRQMYSTFYQQALECSGKRYFLDKTPRYYHIIPELARTFPKAKFIILVRNPISVLASILKTWASPDFYQLRKFKHDLIQAPKLLIEGVKELEGKSLVATSYEKLIANPDMELKNICRQFGMQFESEMLNFPSVSKSGFGYRDQSIKSLEGGVIHSRSEYDWKRSLEVPQHWRLANDYLSKFDEKTLHSMGYSLEKMKRSLIEIRPSRRALLKTLSFEYFTAERYSREVFDNSISARATELLKSIRAIHSL